MTAALHALEAHKPNRASPSRVEPARLRYRFHRASGRTREWNAWAGLHLYLATSRRESDIGAIVGFVEKRLPDELFEQRLARRAVYLPQATRLEERQS